MPDMAASLGLDASEYQSGIEGLGPLSDKAFKRISEDATEAGRNMGKSVGDGGKQAADAVDGVATQADKTVGKIQNAFGKLNWVRMIGAYALIRETTALFEGSLDEMSAYGEMAAAEAAADYAGILAGEKKVDEANQAMVRGLPLLGGIFAKAWEPDIKALDEQIKKVDELEKNTEKMEERSAKMHEETVLEKAKMDGASEADILAMRLAFDEDRKKSTLQKDQEAVSSAATIAAKAEADARAARASAEALAEAHPGAVGIIEVRRGEAEEAEKKAAAAQKLYSGIEIAYQKEEREVAAAAAIDQRRIVKQRVADQEKAQKEAEERDKKEEELHEKQMKRQRERTVAEYLEATAAAHERTYTGETQNFPPEPQSAAAAAAHEQAYGMAPSQAPSIEMGEGAGVGSSTWDMTKNAVPMTVSSAQ